MKKILLFSLIMVMSILPTQAYENQYGIRTSINAGFRLTVPFGATKQKADKIKYGLQLGLRREADRRIGFRNDFRQDGHMVEHFVHNADLLSLNFSENGLKNLSLAGRETFIYKDGIFQAADSGEEGKSSSGWKKGLLIGGGIGVLIAGGLLGGALILASRNS